MCNTTGEARIQLCHQCISQKACFVVVPCTCQVREFDECRQACHVAESKTCASCRVLRTFNNISLRFSSFAPLGKLVNLCAPSSPPWPALRSSPRVACHSNDENPGSMHSCAGSHSIKALSDIAFQDDMLPQTKLVMVSSYTVYLYAGAPIHSSTNKRSLTAASGCA